MYFNDLGPVGGLRPVAGGGGAPVRILIAAPPGQTCKLVDRLVAQQGYQVLHANDVAGADAASATASFDLAVVDLDLGLEPALALVARLSADFPVVIVSGAYVDEADKVRGLESGADDYIARPFGCSEFVARLKVCLRPPHPADRATTVRTYCFAGITLNTRLRLLSGPVAPAPVKLTESEFNLLQAFLDQPQTVLSREDLIAGTRLHGGEVVDRSIDVLIVRLRKKIETASGTADIIRTVRGKGYLFSAEIDTGGRR